MKINKFIVSSLITSLTLIPSVAFASDSSQNVNVDFEHGDSIQLSMSSNVVTFGNISGLVNSEATTPQDLIATVKSSTSYNLYMKATDDFKNSVGDSVSATKLSIGLNRNYQQINSVNSNLALVSNAPKTSKLQNSKQNYSINFRIADVVGEDKGKFIIPLTATAMQI